MIRWPVYVQRWQYECCGDGFEPGDEVTWHVRLAPPTDADADLVVETLSHGRGVLVEDHHMLHDTIGQVIGVVHSVRDDGDDGCVVEIDGKLSVHADLEVDAP